jgi:ATP-dependent protease ClpP protease subunit
MTECRLTLPPALITRSPESLVRGGEIVIDSRIDVVGRVNVAAMRRALAELAGEERLILRFAAGAGGQCEEAIRIYVILRDCPKPITAHVERAASCDTLLVMAAQEVTIVEGGTFMIHSPRTDVHGPATARELRQRADLLDQVEETFLDAYQRRTGLPREQLRDMMLRETWMTSERAVELRFCDRVVPRPRAGDECPALHCVRRAYHS